jgi:hypothetical protein
LWKCNVEKPAGACVKSDRLKSWLTLGANLGVLVGIILILIELNQNAELMRAQIAQIRADNQIASQEARMHSDYWPEITAKLSASNEQYELYNDLSQLNDIERERVKYFYLREINDVRTQYYMLQEGYLPRVVWETSTRSQIERIMSLAAALGRRCNRDTEFQAALNEVASEAGLPQCTGDRIWD